MKAKISKKRRLGLILGAAAVTAGAAAAAASCGVSTAAKQALFQTSSGSGFTTAPGGSVQSLTQAALTDSSGFDALLTAELGNLLGIWYQDNEQSSVANKYQDFVSDVDDSYDATVTAAKDADGANYPLRLQADTYDAAGGSAETYRQNQINNDVVSDFASSLFSTLYLNYTDGSGAVSNPTRAQLMDAANWSKIKFTDGGLNPTDNSSTAKTQRLNETYAEIQEQIFNRWVAEQNPNFVARTVFTSEAPGGAGLKSVFDEDAIGSSDLTASYAFQTFKDNTDDLTSAKGMNAYKQMVGDGVGVDGDASGLGKYVMSADKGGIIDLPDQYSGDSGEKLLMTASDMFSSYDVAFTGAFVQQYLRMQNDPNADAVGAPINPAGSSANGAGAADYNAMDNFLREPGMDPDASGSPAAADPATAYTVPDAKFVKLSPDLADSGFYKQYYELLNQGQGAAAKNVIYNVAEVKGNTAGGDYSDQFILARGKDGVHVMAVDGGSYYLSSGANGSTPTRDLAKQEAFIKFRALLASSGNVASTSSYTFDLGSTLNTYWGSSKEMLWSALCDLYDAAKGGSAANPVNFFNLEANKRFYDAFGAAKDKIDAYVQAYAAAQRAVSLQTNVAAMNAKIAAWGQTYSDLEKALTPEKVGIAAKLPYVRQADGDYFGQAQYYFQVYRQSQPDGAPSFNPQKTTSMADVEAEVARRKQALNAAAAALVADVKQAETPQYSQNVFVSAGDDATFNLGLNMALGAGMSASGVTNAVKAEYFRNDQSFSAFYNFDSATVNASVLGVDQTLLDDTVRTYFKRAAWTGSSDRYAYGSWATQTDLNAIIDRVWGQQNIASDQNSDAAVSWYTTLYTFMWLLQDDLANYKALLEPQIVRGTQAAVSWTVPANPDTLENETDPLAVFPQNPNYVQGSQSNWYNTTAQSVPAPDLFNDATDPYQYTETAGGGAGARYGFAGLTTSDTASGIDSNAAAAMYANYDQSGTAGALYMYGSKDDLLAYVDEIGSLEELNDLVNTLQKDANMDFGQYWQKSNAQYELSFAQKRQLVHDKVSSADAALFNRFSGYIGGAKSSTYADSDPVPESGNAKLTRMATYMQQINYADVAAMGAGWTTDANARLGLDLGSFLAAVALQAQDSTTQSLALDNLLATASGRYVVGDKRLYDALGAYWVTQEKNIYK